MRVVYAALVFCLFLLQKDPHGDPPLYYRSRALPCSAQSKLQQFQNTFCWEPDLCWVAESPWGSYLAGLAMLLMLLMWAVAESWAASCLTTVRTKPRRSTSCLETKTARETDLPQRKQSHYFWRQPSTLGSQSYDQPSGMRRHSYVTWESMGERCQEESLYSQYERSSCSSSSKPSGLSFSSSSSSSIFYLSHLRNLDLLCSSGDSSPAKCSLESMIVFTCGAGSQSSESESESSDSCTALHDPNLTKEEDLCLQAKGNPGSWGVQSLLEKCSEIEIMPLFLQTGEVQTQTSIARINIVQNSAHKKKHHIFLVEKSLQVQMGAAQLPKNQPFLPKMILTTNGVEKREKPTALPMVELMSLRCADKKRECKHVASLRGLVSSFEKAIPTASFQTRECSSLNTIFTYASSLEDSGPVPSVIKKVDDATRDFLEFHIKKKMVQGKCGMPSIVAKSVEGFQSLPVLFQDKLASDSQKPTEIFTLTSMAVVSRAFLHSMVEGTNSSQGALELKKIFILSSWEPEEIHQLAFHAAVKMLEIKMGAFPEMVENSFQLFCGHSEKSLPKVIDLGIKILKPKYPLLPFLAQENICIIDLNIKRKYLAYKGSFSTMYTRLDATETSSSSQLTESEEEPMEEVTQLSLSIWKQIHTVEISYFGLVQPLPAPQLPTPSPASSALPSLRAEEPPEVSFQDEPSKKPVAHQVPAETQRLPEQEQLVTGHQEKLPMQRPSQWALPPSFNQPGPKGTASRKADSSRAEASIIRTSIFLELELKKQKLNLHFKKKMQAKLQPRQGAGLEFTVEREKKAKTPPPQQAHSRTQPPGSPRRSFCYVCMPSDKSGTKLKTVCWALPKWILEMNGYRTPEVARFSSKSKRPQSVQK